MTIDLSALPAPRVIEEHSFETILAEMKAFLIEKLPEIEPTLKLESAVTNKVLQVCAYREVLVRSRINDAARSVMLAFAGEDDIEHIGATFGIERLSSGSGTEGDPIVKEEIERYRRRILLGIHAYSVAGSIEAYIFHALTADITILDAAVQNPRDNRIEVSILSSIGDGTASADQLSRVADALSPSKTRPLTDSVSIRSATIISQPVTARLILPSGPSPAVIKTGAEAGILSYCKERHRIGKVLRVDGIIAAARSGGSIERAIVEAPVADIDPGVGGAVHVPTITVTTEIMT